MDVGKSRICDFVIGGGDLLSLMYLHRGLNKIVKNNLNGGISMARKFITSLTVLLVLLMVSSGTIYAATYLGYGWPSKTIPIKTYSYNDRWQIPMNAAVSSWNNAGAKIKFNKSSSSSNTITAAQYSYTDYGRNYATYSGKNLKSFRIELNSRTISADAKNFLNFVQSTFVHELGHSIWLADNPSTSSASIMKHSRNRNTMIKPQTFDINNVKAKY
ncbi:hypothetical protein MUB24_13355 [Lederbergia sp. NSJ-179]|uniref:hypothetical protein n=1 Tax=Lederbergia sp. NSJ-179 TaxID=2931402 RepID=UPI001FD2C3CF|nr:hypothetical protein [Lederbergia sp. NSJ-179]MCJ7841869.1 hypothetical protein [Lederbergia sp. NSJ-179]